MSNTGVEESALTKNKEIKVMHKNENRKMFENGIMKHELNHEIKVLKENKLEM